MSPARRYVPPRSGTHKQARQAAAQAGLMVARAEGRGPASSIGAVPWDLDTDTLTMVGGAGNIVLPRPGFVRPGEVWEIQRIRLFCVGGRAASPGARCVLYIGEPNDPNALDASFNAGEDVAEYHHPLILNAGEYLTAEFTGAAAVVLARFTIQGVNYLLGEE